MVGGELEPGHLVNDQIHQLFPHFLIAVGQLAHHPGEALHPQLERLNALLLIAHFFHDSVELDQVSLQLETVRGVGVPIN